MFVQYVGVSQFVDTPMCSCRHKISRNKFVYLHKSVHLLHWSSDHIPFVRSLKCLTVARWKTFVRCLSLTSCYLSFSLIHHTRFGIMTSQGTASSKSFPSGTLTFKYSTVAPWFRYKFLRHTLHWVNKSNLALQSRSYSGEVLNGCKV